MTPRWLFFPSTTSSLVIDMSGTLANRFGSGASTASLTVSEPSGGVTGLTGVAMRGDGPGGNAYGLTFFFSSSTNRSNFVTAYPTSSLQLTWNDSLNNVDMQTSATWSWDASSHSTRLFVREDQWSNWQSTSSSLQGETFTLEGI